MFKDQKELEESVNEIYLNIKLKDDESFINFINEVYTPKLEHLQQHMEIVKLAKTIIKGQGKTNLYLTESPIDNSSVEILYAGMTMYYTVIVAGRRETKELSRKLADNGTRYYRRDVINGHNTLLELLERCIWGKVKYAFALFTYQQEERIPYLFPNELLKSVSYYTTLIAEPVKSVYDCTLYDYMGNPVLWYKYRLIEAKSGRTFLASNQSGKYKIIKKY